MIILRSKSYSEYQKGVTKYDRTDQIKGLKDSDVLAEKKRSNARSYVKTAKAGVVGGAVGSVVGAIAGGIKTKSIKGAKAGAAVGGTIGAGVAGSAGLAATHKEREQNRFVNRRLKEAKTQARRREAKDWKTNATGREGYTY